MTQRHSNIKFWGKQLREKKIGWERTLAHRSMQTVSIKFSYTTDRLGVVAQKTEKMLAKIVNE